MAGFWKKCAGAALAATVSVSMAGAQTAPITLSVDLTDAPRKILHAIEVMPVTAGPMTVVYPKWIPGEHGPTGPIENMAGFFITANGQPVKWERDKIDMFAYHLTVPQGVTQLEMKIDFLASSALSGFSAGGSTSENLALLSWNTLLVYPADTDASQVMFTPSVKLPSGWNLGTALDKDGGSGQTSTFKTVSLEQLIDSPVLAGRYFREIPLAPEISPKHYLDMAADGPEQLNLSKEHIADFDKLVRETGALYKSRHYGSYHFLVTLSDEVAHFGLEHHQSSDDRVMATTFTDDREFVLAGLLLPHEFTHSWNGKYRRPAGLATSNYQKPMEGDLLWVYEGLTEYLGDVLAARCGIWTPDQYKQRLSTIAAEYDNRPGRTWRDIQDTATAAQILYAAGGGWDNWRLSVDYYDEGELVWLDVDTTIRKMTNGKKTIDDFVAKFHGLGGDTGPKVVPYTFDDVVAGLNGVVANDWAAFLRSRLDSNSYHAPLGGLENGGYKLTYTDKPNSWSALEDQQSESFDFWYSIGLHANKAGNISDVLKGGVADKGGIGPGMKIVAANGRAYTPDVLKAAIHDAKDSGPSVELIVLNTGYYKVLKLDYHEGERYPMLERVPSVPDRLDDILKPAAK
ncbi:M61 family metallopeptidase [Tunturiibacter gelidoferens]|uniref:Putative metalloprotease with PDZ domain n=1 Tax=Tunturiibacter lichenicola TaxID=2051959 RepID=A0A7Y9NQR8_9BACT|nr:M61 family metallopeptidase [Edaphobacter lichenicola]NYF53662.1 putative metalloprotease with PDZ domain [Edaphobacter lichenicola]